MYKILLLTIALFSTNLNAQDIKTPLADKVVNEVIPVAPGEDWSWVKGHWDWDGGRYKWKRGMYIQKKEGYVWQDGEWERNQKSGWWSYNDGYWQKEKEISDVENDRNTADEDKESKEKRHNNKSMGLFIRTGSSKEI